MQKRGKGGGKEGKEEGREGKKDRVNISWINGWEFSKTNESHRSWNAANKGKLRTSGIKEEQQKWQITNNIIHYVFFLSALKYVWLLKANIMMLLKSLNICTCNTYDNRKEGG